MSNEKNTDDFQDFFKRLRVEIDPDQIEQSIRELGEKVRQVAADGRYTKVRIKFRGKTIIPDVPLSAFIAIEAVTFWYGGIIRALAVNLGVKTFIDIEFIHEGDQLVAAGQALFVDGETEAAEQKYREALSMRPQDPAANYHLGVLLRVLQRTEEAIACLEIAAATEDYENSEKAAQLIERLKGPRPS